jgi:hypothetical protein
LIKLEYWFFVHNDFPCGTNNLRNPICPPLAVFSAEMAVKLPFSNFFSDDARVLVFGPNDFSCGVNNLRNPICPPLAVFSAETAVKPPFLEILFARHWRYFTPKRR